MRTFNAILEKRDLVNAFNSLSAFALTINEMNYVRGGGNPTAILGGSGRPSDDFILP